MVAVLRHAEGAVLLTPRRDSARGAGRRKGALISNPGKRLQGNCTQMRYVGFEPVKAIDTALIEEALRLE